MKAQERKVHFTSKKDQKALSDILQKVREKEKVEAEAKSNQEPKL